jgi:hypothetical protein
MELYTSRLFRFRRSGRFSAYLEHSQGAFGFLVRTHSGLNWLWPNDTSVLCDEYNAMCTMQCVALIASNTLERRRFRRLRTTECIAPTKSSS